MSFRILITCAGGGLVPQAIQYLRHQSRHGSVYVVAVDSHEKALGRHFSNAFELVPRGDHPDYAIRLAEIAESYSVDLILPWSDEEAIAAARNREMFERNGRKLACTDISTLDVLSNKHSTYEMLERAGIPVPQWRCVNTITELDNAVDEFTSLGLEFVVKPAVSRGGRDVSVIRSDINTASNCGGGREIHMNSKIFKNEYIDNYIHNMPVMVMERLYEPTFDLDMLVCDGKLLRSVARRRVNPVVPNDGHIIEERADLYELAPQLASVFNLTWLYDCDIMLDSAGRSKVLEINPRPSGSLAVSVAAGIPLLDDLISFSLGESLPDITIPYGRVITPYTALSCTGEGM